MALPPDLPDSLKRIVSHSRQYDRAWTFYIPAPDDPYLDYHELKAEPLRSETDFEGIISAMIDGARNAGFTVYAVKEDLTTNRTEINPA